MPSPAILWKHWRCPGCLSCNAPVMLRTCVQLGSDYGQRLAQWCDKTQLLKHKNLEQQAGLTMILVFRTNQPTTTHLPTDRLAHAINVYLGHDVHRGSYRQGPVELPSTGAPNLAPFGQACLKGLGLPWLRRNVSVRIARTPMLLSRPSKNILRSSRTELLKSTGKGISGASNIVLIY